MRVAERSANHVRYGTAVGLPIIAMIAGIGCDVAPQFCSYGVRVENALLTESIEYRVEIEQDSSGSLGTRTPWSTLVSGAAEGPIGYWLDNGDGVPVRLSVRLVGDDDSEVTTRFRVHCGTGGGYNGAQVTQDQDGRLVVDPE